MKPILLLTFTLIFLPFLAHSAIYIKFDGIDGESKDKDHKGWIDLNSASMRNADKEGWSDLPSFSQVVQRAGSGPVIMRSRRGPLRVVKEIDKATPLLAKMHESGDVIEFIQIHRKSEDREIRLRFQNAKIVQIESGAKTEQLTIEFDEIRVITPQQIEARRKSGEGPPLRPLNR